MPQRLKDTMGHKVLNLNQKILVILGDLVPLVRHEACVKLIKYL